MNIGLLPQKLLVHSYNPVLFKDFDSAVNAVKYKELSPGELVFAYYKDNSITRGYNVLFAVGAFINEKENIIFENNSMLDSFLENLSDISTKIINVNDNILKITGDISKTNQTVSDVSDKLNDLINNGVGNTTSIIDPSIDYKIDKASLDILLYVDRKNNEQNNSITDLYNKVNNINSSLSNDFSSLYNRVQSLENVVNNLHVDISNNIFGNETSTFINYNKEQNSILFKGDVIATNFYVERTDDLTYGVAHTDSYILDKINSISDRLLVVEETLKTINK